MNDELIFEFEDEILNLKFVKNEGYHTIFSMDVVLWCDTCKVDYRDKNFLVDFESSMPAGVFQKGDHRLMRIYKELSCLDCDISYDVTNQDDYYAVLDDIEKQKISCCPHVDLELKHREVVHHFYGEHIVFLAIECLICHRRWHKFHSFTHYLDFDRKYEKLENPYFTTIRSTKKAEYLKVGDIVDIRLRGKKIAKARITDVKVLPFDEIDTKTLMEDVKSAEWIPNTREDAEEIMNQYVSLDGDVALFTLERTTMLNRC